MLFIILVILIVIQGVIWAFASRLQPVTLYLGKQIVIDEDLLFLGKRGMQDVITPKFMNYSNIGTISIIIIGSLIKWYIGILGVAISLFFIARIFRLLMPIKMSFYTNIIVFYLTNEFADYKKNGDIERANASKVLLDSIMEWHIEATINKLDVPTFTKARNL